MFFPYDFFPHTQYYSNCVSEIPHVYISVSNGLIFKLAVTFVQRSMCEAAQKLRLTDGKAYIYIYVFTSNIYKN